MLHHVREEYQSGALDITKLDKNPIVQFHHWFQDVLKADIPDPNAMTLSTSTPDGKPSARIVLLKDYSEDGFSFYTNYESRKGVQMKENPFVSLTFFWQPLHRQIRVEGKVEKLSSEVSNEYFQSRPRGSQVGAWASPQSAEIQDRDILITKVEDIQKRFEAEEALPLPPFWGGYLVKPSQIEFWQGQPSRLHDRALYKLIKNGSWELSRLAP